MADRSYMRNMNSEENDGILFMFFMFLLSK